MREPEDCVAMRGVLPLLGLAEALAVALAEVLAVVVSVPSGTRTTTSERLMT